MPVVFVIGRAVLVLYFIFAGLQRLMNITGSAEFFAQKFAIPAALAAASTQLEAIVGLTTPQILALLAGAIELAAGLLIAFNVGTRAMAVVLILMTAIGMYYSNNFWTMFDGQRDINLTEALLQISLIGGLLVFVALGSRRPGESPTEI
jgi:putative oxidoreductase